MVKAVREEEAPGALGDQGVVPGALVLGSPAQLLRRQMYGRPGFFPAPAADPAQLTRWNDFFCARAVQLADPAGGADAHRDASS
jgi:hypothetical protein